MTKLCALTDRGFGPMKRYHKGKLENNPLTIKSAHSLDWDNRLSLDFRWRELYPYSQFTPFVGIVEC